MEGDQPRAGPGAARAAGRLVAGGAAGRAPRSAPARHGPQALAEKIWAWEQEQFPVKGPRRRRVVQDCPRLSINEVLAWADAHLAATGDWPACHGGKVCAAPYDVSWRAVDCACRGAAIAACREARRSLRYGRSTETSCQR